MTSRRDTAERLWLKLTSGRQEASTDKAAELRRASMARLRQTRLSKEAEDKVRAAPAAVKNMRLKGS